MVFGESLVVPGEFFPSPPDSDKKDTDLDRLRRIADGTLRPSHLATTRIHTKLEYIPKAPSTCEYVFVLHDAAQPPLSPPYRSPFRVLQRREKAFQLQLGNRVDWVSIDRLKPAYIDATEHDDAVYTRHGRLSRPPDLIAHPS